MAFAVASAGKLAPPAASATRRRRGPSATRGEHFFTGGAPLRRAAGDARARSRGRARASPRAEAITEPVEEEKDAKAEEVRPLHERVPPLVAAISELHVTSPRRLSLRFLWDILSASGIQDAKVVVQEAHAPNADGAQVFLDQCNAQNGESDGFKIHLPYVE